MKEIADEKATATRMVNINLDSPQQRLELVICGVVFLNVFIIALETDLSADGRGFIWIILDVCFLLIYMVEIAIRLYLERQACWRSPWNCLDVIVVLIGLITVAISSSDRVDASISLLRLLKLVRLVRLVKLSHLFPEVLVVISASKQDIITVLSLMLAATFGVFAFSIPAVSLIGRNKSLQSIRIGERGASVDERFGTIPRAFASLFELMVLDGWDTMCRPIVDAQPWLFLFILSVIVLFTFGALNVIVALVIQKCNFHSTVRHMTEAEHKREFTKKCLQRINTIVELQFGKDANLTHTDFVSVLKGCPPLLQLFRGSGFTPFDIKRLIDVLDRDKSRTVSSEELITCVENLIMGDGCMFHETAAYSELRCTKKYLGSFSEVLANARREELLWRAHIEELQKTHATALGKLISCLCQPPSQQQDGHPAQQVVSANPPQPDCSCWAVDSCNGQHLIKPGVLPHQVPSDDEMDGANKYPIWVLELQGVPTEDETESEIAEINGQPALAHGRGCFRMFFHALTILNILAMAVETSLEESNESDVAWIVVDTLFVVAFCVEIAVRIYWERKAWIRRGWNWFDLVVTLLSVLDVWVLSSVDSDSLIMQTVPALRVLRVARVVRLLKFMQASQQFYAVLMTILFTMQTLSNLFLVLFVSIFVYGILMVSLIGRSEELRDVRTRQGDAVLDRFRTTPSAMFTLFELMTLEGWVDVYRPLVVRRFWVFAPVAVFIVCFTYAMLNMITAFIIEKNIECKADLDTLEEERTVRVLHRDLAKVKKRVEKDFGALEDDLSYEMFESILLTQAPVRRALVHIGCSARSCRDIYEVFDWDCSGHHTIEEFFEGLNNLQDCLYGATALWHFLAVRATAEGNERQIGMLIKSIVAWRSDLVKQHAAMENSLAEQEEALWAISKCPRLALLAPA